MTELGLEYLKGVRVSTSKHWENNWSSTLYNALGKKCTKQLVGAHKSLWFTNHP